jgi:hypothetical protein
MTNTDTKPNLPTCRCLSHVAYRVTAEDLPETDPDTFVEFDVHESCGTVVSKGKQFAPGHDAKLKSVLIAAFRAGEDFAYLEGGLLIHSDPMAMAQDRDWGKFLTPAKPRKVRKIHPGQKAADKRRASQGQAQPDSDQPVHGFRPCQVKVGRWWKDGNVMAFPAEGKITVSYTDGKGEARSITVDADKVKEG